MPYPLQYSVEGVAVEKILLKIVKTFKILHFSPLKTVVFNSNK